MARKQTRNEQYAGGFPPGMEAFEKLTDPRNGRAKRHYFGEVLFIALAAMVSGMDDFADFERFAQQREEWLRKWLKLPHGTPSDDAFRRIFTALNEYKASNHDAALLQLPKEERNLVESILKQRANMTKNSA
jgi:hypothetical protein